MLVDKLCRRRNLCHRTTRNGFCPAAFYSRTLHDDQVATILKNMSRIAQTVVSAWIMVALLVVPLPAFSFVQASPESDHCLPGKQHNHKDLHLSHQQQSETTDRTSCCKHCSNDRCEEGSCSDQNCPSFNSLTILMVTADSCFPAIAEIFPLTVSTGSLSRTSPPLLRPPA